MLRQSVESDAGTSFRLHLSALRHQISRWRTPERRMRVPQGRCTDASPVQLYLYGYRVWCLGPELSLMCPQFGV
jgi:hypothetical protein